MDLIIVESPTKSKTITKFLGKNYKILASFGHVRDLPKSDLGIDVDNGFEPKYVIPTKAKKNVTALKKAALEADNVILATDPDREGEAISWHILSILDSKAKVKYKRIAFHEITQSAIQDALDNPRDIDINLVNSQQARRILDRLVGYKLSPLLWKKIAKGLSAGRVQSIALRLICDREKEILAFIPQEYWSVQALLKKKNSKEIFEASLSKKDGKAVDKLEIKNEQEAKQILKDLENAQYIVEEVEQKETRKLPSPPFTTSTLQQNAWNTLKYSAKMTMSLAQQLYEQGLISYHRTDSTNLSEQSLKDAHDYLSKNLGKEYALDVPRHFKTKSKMAQEAHEAIRPTHPDNTPQSLKDKLNPKQIKIYELIWRRFLACQAQPAIFDSFGADIVAKNYTFRATGSSIKFDGFLKIYPQKQEDKYVPALEKGENLDLDKLNPEQHFTQPPARYNDASLIKKLEEYGIGRPSTYSSIISVVQERNYVIKDDQKRFTPTEIGTSVNDLLAQYFSEIVDYNFTAQMENELDEIAENKKDWQEVVKDFYLPFAKDLAKGEKEIQGFKPADEKTDKICPDCGKPLIIKFGRFGKFYACSGFPDCKYTAPLETAKIEIKCPECKEGDIIQKKTKRGKIFFSCSNWPKCQFATWDKPIDEFCPKCGKILTQSIKNVVKCSNKECDYKK